MATFDLPVGTYNLGDGPFAAKVEDLGKLSEHVVLLMLSEAGDRTREIERFIEDHPTWGLYLGDGTSGASSTPIVWNAEVLQQVEAATSEAVPSRFVGPQGAGPAKIKRKVNNRLRFRHLGSGLALDAYSVHALPSVTRKNLPATERRRRLEHYERHMASLAEDIKRRRALVVVGGDFNAPPSFPGLAPLRQARMVCDADEATHHGKAIDQVWHREADAITSTGRITLKLSSDHRAMVEKLQIVN